LVVSVVNMLVGALWYSRAFLGSAWMKSLGFKDEDLKSSPVRLVLVFVMGLVIAIFMAMFLQGVDNVATGLAYGAILSVGLVIPTMITHYLMEMRKGALMFIVAGHELVIFMIYGAVLTAWQ